MTKRTPTPAELKLWRESNRFTRKKSDDPEWPEGDEAEIDPAPVQAAMPVTVAKAPSKTRALSPLQPLNARDGAKLRKSEIEATLDLHGLTKLDAYARVRSFLHDQYRAGRRHVLIITGKGRAGDGLLRRELPHWLNEPELRPYLSAFTHGRPEKGGNGVTHVLMKSYRD